MRKGLIASLLVSAALTVSPIMTTTSFAAIELKDIQNSYAKDAISELVNKGIINGISGGNFNPTGNIQRQDFAIILAKALSLDVSSAPATSTFSDVPTTHYSFKYVEAATKAGLIKGQGDGEFGIGENLSRQDMAVLFVRALGTDVAGYDSKLTFSDKDQIADYAKDSVGVAVELGLISGNAENAFNPMGGAERQAVALVASKFLKVKEELDKPEQEPEKPQDTDEEQVILDPNPNPNPNPNKPEEDHKDEEPVFPGCEGQVIPEENHEGEESIVPRGLELTECDIPVIPICQEEEYSGGDEPEASPELGSEEVVKE